MLVIVAVFSISVSKPELLHGVRTGEAVKSLQTALAGHGFAVTIDGDFGPATQKAVKGFQAAFHLRPDGIVGPNTTKELGL